MKGMACFAIWLACFLGSVSAKAGDDSRQGWAIHLPDPTDKQVTTKDGNSSNLIPVTVYVGHGSNNSPAQKLWSTYKLECLGKVKYLGRKIYNQLIKDQQIKSAVAGNVIVQFNLAPTGTIQSTRIAKSSGNPVLDKIALQAVELSAPYPPAPENLLKGSLNEGNGTAVPTMVTHIVIDADMRFPGENSSPEEKTITKP